MECPLVALDVVVALYSDRSFEPWLADLSRALEGAAVVRSVVYDKSGSAVALPAADEHVRLRNIGRESESYLQHIVRNYEQGLAAYTLFVQDDIASVHVPKHHREGFYARIHRVVRVGDGGEVLQVAYRGRKLAPRRRIAAGDPLYGRLHDACVRFGIAMPSEYETNVCAILLVSKESASGDGRARFTNACSRGTGRARAHPTASAEITRSRCLGCWSTYGSSYSLRRRLSPSCAATGLPATTGDHSGQRSAGYSVERATPSRGTSANCAPCSSAACV